MTAKSPKYDIIFEGFLDKWEGFMSGGWKKRWTVLRSQPGASHYRLSTHQKEQDYTKPTINISIDSSTNIKEVSKRNEPRFNIINKSHEYEFRAHSKKDRTNWLSHLQFNTKDEEKKEYIPNEVHQHHRHHHGPKKKVSLIFVGETGVGKTTLLTSLEDFINGVKYEEVNTTKKPKSIGLSQTQKTAQFPLSNKEWAVNIIDTPGIGDTAGVDTDEKHMGSIIDFIGDYGDFNAVCILIKRGTSRLTTRMKYVVNEIKSNMPKDVQNNFIVIMTRADVPVPDEDTKAVIKGLDLPTGNIIPVNNGAYEELDLSEYPKGSPIIKSIKQRHKTDYALNHAYLQTLLETASKMVLYQGNKMKELKQKRDKLKEQVGLLKRTMDDSFDTENQINEQLAELKAATTMEQMNKAFDQSKNHIEYEYYKVKGKITTNCNVCSKSCHIDCQLSYGDELTECWVSGPFGNCTQCGCSMSDHCHLGWKRKEKIVWIENVNQEMKDQYETAQQTKTKIEQRKRQLKAKLKQLERKRDKCTREIQKNYAELEQMAIIGYNESYESYMKECKKAVEKDVKLTREQKEKKITGYDTAIATFHYFKEAIGGTINQIGNECQQKWDEMTSLGMQAMANQMPLYM